MNTLKCYHEDCNAHISLEVEYRDVQYDDSVAVLVIRCEKHGTLIGFDSYDEHTIKDINRLIMLIHP